VLLPFVVAMIEYDMPAHEVALDGASGAIDLALEAQLLERPDRLAAAEKRAGVLIKAALARFDANRTATREMRDVLGLPDEPWLGVDLGRRKWSPAWPRRDRRDRRRRGRHPGPGAGKLGIRDGSPPGRARDAGSVRVPAASGGREVAGRRRRPGKAEPVRPPEEPVPVPAASAAWRCARPPTTRRRSAAAMPT
jgi:hypothetical protein